MSTNFAKQIAFDDHDLFFIREALQDAVDDLAEKLDEDSELLHYDDTDVLAMRAKQRELTSLIHSIDFVVAGAAARAATKGA